MTSKQPEQPEQPGPTLEDPSGRLLECILTHSDMGSLTVENRSKVLALISRHTDVMHVRSINLGATTSTPTVYGTDTGNHRYLVDGDMATVSIEIDEGLIDIQ